MGLGAGAHVSTGFVFPGQGSQKVGMAAGLSRRRFAEADDALGFALSKIDRRRARNRAAADRLYAARHLTVSVAMADALAERGVAAEWCAGHSLGEYSALVYAGTLDFADAVRLVHLRGRFMQEAVPEGVGAMAALVGLDARTVSDTCLEASPDASDACQPANFNGGGQVVIAGHRAAVERAMALAKQKGAKLVKALPVSAPFHSALMAPAAERLRAALAEVSIGPLRVPVIANVTAEPNRESGQVKHLLYRQVTGSVRWEESVRTLAKVGVTEIYEVGPGKVLEGLLKRIAPRSPSEMGDEHVSDAQGPEKGQAAGKVEKRVALVTGASRGIGRAIAVALAQDGLFVIINYTANEGAAGEALALVQAKALESGVASAGGALSRFDVADAAQVDAAVKQIALEHGQLDVLVNNAGIAIDGLLLRTKKDDWARTLEVNLSGAFHCTKAAARYLLKAPAGRVVNISSVVGEQGNAGQVSYAAAKAGLIGMTKTLARELASREVTVNCVTPGFIETDMTAVHVHGEARAGAPQADSRSAGSGERKTLQRPCASWSRPRRVTSPDKWYG